MKVPALMGLCFREVSLGKKRITHTTINNKYYGEKSAGKGDGVSVGGSGEGIGGSLAI